MAKTLLQLLNEVGKNLRLSDGDDFTSLTQDADAVFIVQMINEGKRMVEAEHEWDSLQATITFSTVASTQTYDTSDLTVVTSDPVVTNERSKLVYDEQCVSPLYEVTNGDEWWLRQRTRNWVRRERLINGDDSTTRPGFFAAYQNGDGITIEFPYDIAQARDYALIVYNPQEDLAAVDTELTVPWRPVVLAATALAADERGEELGMESLGWWERYQSALSEALVIEMFNKDDMSLVAD